MMSKSNRHLEAAGQSIAYNIIFQIIRSLFTFLVNAITLRYQSSVILGIINVRLALLYTTLQFCSREPFRRACLGSTAKSKDPKSWQKIVNTIWLGFISAFLMSFPLSYLWILRCPSIEDLDGDYIDDYQKAVMITCVVVLVEMLAEPCYIYAQAKAITDHNFKIEVLFVILKCILTLIVTVMESYQKEPYYLLSKIVSCQLAAALISVIISYERLCSTQNLTITKFLPSVKSRQLDNECFDLVKGFASQTFIKQLLTEGERYIMTFFNLISLSDQGIYDVVNNLGSLVARFIFRPIEDSAYTFFSQEVSRTEKLSEKEFNRLRDNLMNLMKAVLLIGLTVLTFGWNYVPLIAIYGGKILNNPEAFVLMKGQLFYTPLLAINGVTEAFTFAASSSSDIQRYNLSLLITLVTIPISIITNRYLGSLCFIFSNCVGMILRIRLSSKFIVQYYKKHGYQWSLVDALPSKTTNLILGILWLILWTLSLYSPYSIDLTLPIESMVYIALGVICMILTILVVIRNENTLIVFVLSKLFRLNSLLTKLNRLDTLLNYLFGQRVMLKRKPR